MLYPDFESNPDVQLAGKQAYSSVPLGCSEVFTQSPSSCIVVSKQQSSKHVTGRLQSEACDIRAAQNVNTGEIQSWGSSLHLHAQGLMRQVQPRSARGVGWARGLAVVLQASRRALSTQADLRTTPISPKAAARASEQAAAQQASTAPCYRGLD